jgi:hypothetical protein
MMGFVAVMSLWRKLQPLFGSHMLDIHLSCGNSTNDDAVL